MSRRILGAVLASCALLAACGGDKTPGEKALGQAQSHLADVHSGTLSMTFLASTAAAPAGQGLGFSLRGPFAVASKKGTLPVARLEYTRITGSRRRTTAFISTGAAAFVELDGVTYRLTPAQVADLRATDEGGGGLDGLALEDWIDSPRVTSAGTRDGVAVQRISGRVDAVKAFNGVVGLAHDYGASSADAPAPLEGAGADRVRAAVRSSQVEALVGRDDHLLRSFGLVIELAPGSQQRLRSALGRFTGVRLRFDIGVARPNTRVTVRPPTHARPASEIPQEG
ncbi:MAG: hypothetical protein QOE35_751 [Actinomycetota bacterium]